MPAPSVSAYANPSTAADESRCAGCATIRCRGFTSPITTSASWSAGTPRRRRARLLGDTQFMLPSHSVALPRAGEFFRLHLGADQRRGVLDLHLRVASRAAAPAEERARFEKGGHGQFAELGPGYVPLRNRSNDYLIDREDQNHRSFTGVSGIAERMRSPRQPVAHRRPHAGEPDGDRRRGGRFRRYMLEAARALARAGARRAAPRGELPRPGGRRADPCELSFDEVMGSVSAVQPGEWSNETDSWPSSFCRRAPRRQHRTTPLARSP